jgi:predicted aspartyl protease
MSATRSIMLTAALVAAASGPCQANMTPAAAGYTARVTFTDHRNEILIPVLINHRGPYMMLLDTGTTPSVLDRETAADLRLSAERGQEIPIASTSIGGRIWLRQSAVITDLSALSRSLGVRIDGVVGFPFLRDSVVQIDWRRRTVELYASLPPNDGRRRTVVPFRLQDTDVILEGVSVNGTVVSAFVDTGNNGTLIVTPAGAAKLGLGGQGGKPREVTGFDGVSATIPTVLDEVRIGEFDVHSVAARMYRAGSRHDADAFDVNVGNAFLRNYRVTIDYRLNRFVLESP